MVVPGELTWPYVKGEDMNKTHSGEYNLWSVGKDRLLWEPGSADEDRHLDFGTPTSNMQTSTSS